MEATQTELKLEAPSQQPETMALGIRTGAMWGLYTGLAACLIEGLLWFVDPALLASPINYVTALGPLVVAVFAALQVRKQNGGYIRLLEVIATIGAFFVVMGLLNAIFTYVLYNFVDPTLAEKIKEAVMAQQESMMDKFGSSDEQKQQVLDSMKKTSMAQPIGTVLKGFAIAVGVGLIYGAVVGLFVQKKQPLIPVASPAMPSDVRVS
jgi:tetrahydromethanopterin S-methyltransferase subunit G